MTDSIEDCLDIEEELPTLRIEIEPAVRKTNTEEPKRQDFIDDYNFARDTLNTVIKTGVEALNGAMNAAVESGHPRAFEVASTIMNQLAGASKDLLSLSEVATKISTLNEADPEKTEENYFTGSTKDLNAMVDESTDK